VLSVIAHNIKDLVYICLHFTREFLTSSVTQSFRPFIGTLLSCGKAVRTSGIMNDIGA
jgi:hypothetical protein